MTPKERVERQSILTTAHGDYERRLTTYAFSRLHDHAKGQDLVQDTFLKTWSYLARGGRIDVMRAFLYHVLNNLIVDEYRKRRTDSLDILLANGFEPATTSDTPRQLLHALDAKRALLLIGKLPEKYQRAMRMRYVQDLSLLEMSLITGQTKNTMAVHVHRGLAKLRVLYDGS